MIKYAIWLIVQTNLMGLPAAIYISHPNMQSCNTMLEQFASDPNIKSAECIVKEYRST